ncbi:hypothetical protein ACQY0O_005409 [Thecaphora frezii]
MGNCASKSNPVVDEAPPPPHPKARKVTLIAVPLDPQLIPLDLNGIDAGGLKGAMLHRGLEAEHWALKVDPAAGDASPAQVFDISVQGGKMVSSVTNIHSPFWNGICRKQELGWTLWNDNEILNATKLLIQARPKYDGRTNNLQQLARILARHIQYTPESDGNSAPSLQKHSAPPSQSTEESQQRADSLESSDPPFMGGAWTTNSVKSSSLRQSSRGRSSLAHKVRSSSTTEVNEAVERPVLSRASLSEQQIQRLQAARRSTTFASSPLNPEKQQPTHRPRTKSDVTQVEKRRSKHPREQSQDDRRRSTLSQTFSHSHSRLKSQIPAEWNGEARRNSAGHSGGDPKASQTGSLNRMSRRESQMNFFPPPLPTFPAHGNWNPTFAPPTPPMMAMNPYEMPPGMSPYMGGYAMPHSGSMYSLHSQHQQQGQQTPPMTMARPMSYYGPPMSIPWGMPPPIGRLTPPSPCMTPNMVPTPPESPMPPVDQHGKHLQSPPGDFKLGQSRASPAGQHSKHTSAR